MSTADERGAWPEALVDEMTELLAAPFNETPEVRALAVKWLDSHAPAIFAAELRCRVAAMTDAALVEASYAMTVDTKGGVRSALLRLFGVEAPDGR